MKNITVSVDEATYRNARVKAAAMDTSVSALVKKFLAEFGSADTGFERRKRQEQAIRAEIQAFSASENLSREELYDRRG